MGEITLQQGTTSMTVSTPAAVTSSTILLTPLSDPGLPLWINPPIAGSFTIGASAALPASVTVRYHVIN